MESKMMIRVLVVDSWVHRKVLPLDVRMLNTKGVLRFQYLKKRMISPVRTVKKENQQQAQKNLEREPYSKGLMQALSQPQLDDVAPKIFQGNNDDSLSM